MCVRGSRYWEKTKIAIHQKLIVCWNRFFCSSNVVLAQRALRLVLNHPGIDAFRVKYCRLDKEAESSLYIPCPHCRVRILSAAVNELKQIGQSSCLILEKEVDGNMRSSWGFDLGIHAFFDSYTVMGCVRNMNRNGFSCVSALNDVDTIMRKAANRIRRTVSVHVQEWERKMERMIGILTCFYTKSHQQHSQFDHIKWQWTGCLHTQPSYSVVFSLCQAK